MRLVFGFTIIWRSNMTLPDKGDTEIFRGIEALKQQKHQNPREHAHA